MKPVIERGLLALGLAGCSSVAQPAGERWCQEDSDCYAHERCSQAHDGRCVSRQLPRRPSFGLAGLVQARGPHGDLQIPWEFRGCEIDAFDPDTGVSRINLDRKLRPLHLGNLSYNRPYETSCAASCAPQAFCDPINGQCAFARHGHWTAIQESRLGLAPLEAHLRIPERPLEQAHRGSPPSLTFPWPCGPHATRIRESNQKLTAQLHTPELNAHEHQRILAPMPCALRGERTLESAFHDLSWRSIRSSDPGLEVKTIDGVGEGLGEDPAVRFDLEWVRSSASVELMMARSRPGVHAAAERKCGSDQECSGVPGLVAHCSDAGRCMVREPQAPVLQSKDLIPGVHREPRHPGGARASRVHVSPNDPRLARMQVALEPRLPNTPLRDHEAREPKTPRLCLPLWSLPDPPRPIALHSPFGPIDWQHHSPLPLLTGRMACNAADLARGDGHDLGPCIADERPRVRLLASLNDEGQKAFQRESCLRPEPLGKPFGQGQDFELALPLDCDDAGRCQVWPAQSPFAGPCHHIVVELERPSDSLFRSMRRVFPEAHCTDQEPKALSLPNPWQPRPLIRGVVQVPGDNADAMHVEVLAERLNRGEENPQGPFFFHQQVVITGPSQGQFALPVEPGHYVVTALAHHPLQWGPAPYAIVDLSAPGGETPEIHLQLQTGPLVQVQVHAPETMHQVRARPIDLGSWKGDPSFPDLNRPQTCFPLHRGCAIRMLSAPHGEKGREIPADIRSVLRWTSRPGGPVECP